MNIQTLTLGPLATNCYLVRAEESRRAVIIDPAANSKRLLAALEEQGLTLEAILLTHAHFDHILGLPALGNVPIYVHELDAPAMTDAVRNCAEDRLPAVSATHLVHEGDVLHLAGMTFTVMHTPGHTPGGVCYQCGDDLFTGDTLFAPGYGRTDLPGGSWSDLVRSLRRLLHLPGNLHVYPGHGGDAELSALRGNL